jgi:HEPN domain-containing protein
VDRQDLRELSRVRLKASKALLDLRFYDGAYYLAGYAVECALKACIAKSTRRYEFPERDRVNKSYTHDLRELVKLEGLEDDRSARAKVDPKFKEYWETVQDWSEQSRYRRYPAVSAEALLEAASHPQHGVISWIALHW